LCAHKSSPKNQTSLINLSIKPHDKHNFKSTQFTQS